MEEFRYNKFLRITMLILGPGIVLLGVYLFYLAITEQQQIGLVIFLALVALFMVGLGSLGVAELLRARYRITGEVIEYRGLFKSRYLPWSAVKGYRMQNTQYHRTLVLEPVDGSFKKIMIPLLLTNNYRIQELVVSRARDLDHADQEDDLQQLMNDPDLSIAPEEFETRLLRAKRIAKWTNGIAVAVMLWTMFHPRPYELALIASAIYPFIAILVMRTSNGLIRLNDDKSKALPDIGLAILLPGMAIGLRGLLDRDLYDHGPVWPLLIAGVLIMLLLVFFRNREYPANQWKSLGMYLLMGVLLSFHVYGTIVFINCYYDENVPQVQEAVVVGHRISSGRSKSYHIQVEDIDDVEEFREFTVTSKEFDMIQLGDTLMKVSMPGQLGIPWGYIDR